MPAADVNSCRLRLIEQLLHLPEDHLVEVERFLNTLLSASPAAEAATDPVLAQRDWPHAPRHRLSEAGTYIVTAGTYLKDHYFRSPARLDYLEANLLSSANEAGWQLEAWAVFSNHYHFVGHAGAGCEALSSWVAAMHQRTSGHVNELDRSVGQRVWCNYWDTQLTFEKSYLARLSYVHQNPVRHGLVRLASAYRWCSAGWFERTATPAQVRTIYSFKTDQIHVRDDFEPI